jgi:hypothetical protein
MSLVSTVYRQFRFAQTLSREMIEAGSREVTIKQLDLQPIPAVCVFGLR